MFFCYNQNNSGGGFYNDDKVGHYVIIEAEDTKKADALAESKAGIYFDGSGDCSCCGNRWHETFDEGSEEPEIYGKSIEEHIKGLDYLIGDEEFIHVYYLDGKHEKFSVDRKQIQKNKANKRKVADSL